MAWYPTSGMGPGAVKVPTYMDYNDTWGSDPSGGTPAPDPYWNPPAPGDPFRGPVDPPFMPTTKEDAKSRHSSGGGGGGGGGSSSSGGQYPGYYDYLKGLTKDINALYKEMNSLNTKELAIMRGWYDSIVPDLKEQYLSTVQSTKAALSRMAGMEPAAENVVRGLLSGELIDPVVQDAIKRAVGYTGGGAIAQGAPLKGNSYLTQAATSAATESAAPIKLQGQIEGVNLLGGLQDYYSGKAQLGMTPGMLGLTALDMANQAHRGLLETQTYPMNWRLGALGQGSDLMGNAISQVLMPYNFGISLGNMWAPYASSEQWGQSGTTKKTLPL